MDIAKSFSKLGGPARSAQNIMIAEFKEMRPSARDTHVNVYNSLIDLLHNTVVGNNTYQLKAINNLKSTKAARMLSDRNWAAATKLFSVGFELETHATNGVTAGNIERACEKWNAGIKLDPKRYEDALVVKAKTLYTQPQFIRSVVEQVPELIQELARKLLVPMFFAEVKDTKSTLEQCIDFVNTQVLAGKPAGFVVDVILARVSGAIDITPLVATLPKELQDSINRTALMRAREELSPDAYLTGVRLNRDTFRKTKLLPQDLPGSALVDAGTDGSVEGFEFRTVGALSVRQFVQALDVVFHETVTHKVDVGCSFHLHVGLGKEVKFSFNPLMQAHVYEYLMEHLDEVPKSVLTRWDTLHTPVRPGNNYFAASINSNKYTFVHFHQKYGTLEYRCFGNINSKAEALVCLRLAMRATRYALDAILHSKPLKYFTDYEIASDTAGKKMVGAIKARKSIDKIMPVSQANLKRAAGKAAARK